MSGSTGEIRGHPFFLRVPTRTRSVASNRSSPREASPGELSLNAFQIMGLFSEYQRLIFF